VAAGSSLPIVARDSIAAALCAWAVGIMWSRLALGAHYLTDVLRGAFFGFAWLLALIGFLLSQRLS
jgi:membrane-associated phospholipid phosphatase